MRWPHRIPLALTPTPMQRLVRMSHHTGVDFWMKREDLTGDLGLGGNKVRKLEFLLADALAQGATHLLTTGGPQSNHARATAAAAARVGLKCVLVLAGRSPAFRQGNLLLDELYGAEIRFPGAVTAEGQVRELNRAADELKTCGARPYIIPIGGSTPLGTVGSLSCFEEMKGHLEGDPWICCATGSGGTHAGLALGAHLSESSVRVQGFSVWQPSHYIAPITSALAAETGDLLGITGNLEPVNVDDHYLAPRYGKASPQGLEAIRLLASMEGILLDHVYTAKAMAGVLDYIATGRIEQGERVIFIHTGGTPALFAQL